MCRMALQIVGWVLSQADGKFYYQNTVSDASGACDHSLIHYSFKLLSFFYHYRRFAVCPKGCAVNNCALALKPGLSDIQPLATLLSIRAAKTVNCPFAECPCCEDGELSLRQVPVLQPCDRVVFVIFSSLQLYRIYVK